MSDVGWLRRRERVPEEVREAASVPHGERVLASCRSGESGYLVASDCAFYVVSPPDSQRIRWDLVDRAAWKPPFLTMSVYDPDSDSVQTRALAADPDSDLPSVVRDRVTRTILVNNRIDVPGGHARVVGRRDSDGGTLWWRVVHSTGVDRDDPAVKRAVQEELGQLRSAMGV